MHTWLSLLLHCSPAVKSITVVAPTLLACFLSSTECCSLDLCSCSYNQTLQTYAPQGLSAKVCEVQVLITPSLADQVPRQQFAPDFELERSLVAADERRAGGEAAGQPDEASTSQVRIAPSPYCSYWSLIAFSLL